MVNPICRGRPDEILVHDQRNICQNLPRASAPARRRKTRISPEPEPHKIHSHPHNESFRDFLLDNEDGTRSRVHLKYLNAAMQALDGCGTPDLGGRKFEIYPFPDIPAARRIPANPLFPD